VFDHWRREHGHQKAKLDQKRRARISARLKDFTADQLCSAITNAKNDPFLMGEDPRANRKFDGIETLLRDTTQVERLLELDKPQPRRATGPQLSRSEDQLQRQIDRVADLSDGDPWELEGPRRLGP
jgi:hypothetical protein